VPAARMLRSPAARDPASVPLLAPGAVSPDAAAVAAPSAPRRLIYVQFDAAEGFQGVALHEGLTREDVEHCLRVAAGLHDDDGFSLVDAADEALVPVSVALPHGSRLVLKRRPGARRASGGGGARAQASPGDATPKSKDSDAMRSNTEAMKNFSKISNYLANDRTLLAWTRTSLSLGRTLFSVAALTVVGEGGGLALASSTTCLALLTIVLFAVGWFRFVEVRSALDNGDAPHYMLDRLARVGRPTIAFDRVFPTHALLFGVVLVLAVGSAAHVFSKS